MVRDGEIGHDRLTEALCFHVVGVVRADGHAGVDHLGDGVHDLLDLLLQLGLLGLQLLQALGLGGNLGLHGLSLFQLAGVLLGLAHQRADLLGQGVALRTQAAGLADGGAVLRVQRDDLIHQGQLGLLELLLDVLLDCVGVFPHELNVQHDVFPFLFRQNRPWDIAPPRFVRHLFYYSFLDELSQVFRAVLLN